MNRLADWINDNPYLILLAFLFLFYSRCSSPQVADTVRIQERSEAVTTNLDNAANDCLTENCKKAMKQAKELIKDSLDVMMDKDSDLQKKQKEIDSSSLYTAVGKWVIWGAVVLLIGILLYIFREQIFTILKLAKPI
ncbi:MAG TPA: hypothetical protein PLG41_23535 [Leptospiraceae bacterium]|nr:hypothetical protein [Leptospiraceae bacterium]